MVKLITPMLNMTSLVTASCHETWSLKKVVFVVVYVAQLPASCDSIVVT